MPMACNVTPDEYMSKLLMANSWSPAKIMKTTTNHGGMMLWWARAKKPPVPCPIPTMKVATAALRVMIRISGSAVPRKDGGARLGALEGANPQQEVREVADDDEGQGLNERELEDAHQDAAANEVLD